MTIISHDFNDNLINQLSEDTEINGVMVPKGYVNLNQMCSANGKKLNGFTRLKSSSAFIILLDEKIETETHSAEGSQIPAPSSTKVSVSPCVISIPNLIGGDGDTYGEIRLALKVAAWISSEFDLWAMDVLMHVINGDVTGLTLEAKESIAKLGAVWQSLRDCSKESFWFIASAIKKHYDANPRIEHYPGENYSEVFDLLNMGLFGKKSKQIKTELGISKGQLNREHFGEESLKRIDMIQRIAEAQILYSFVVPMVAVEFALKTLHYSVIDFKR